MNHETEDLEHDDHEEPAPGEPTFDKPLLPVGIHYAASMLDYLRDPGLSTGMLIDILERSPAHAKLAQGRRDDLKLRAEDATEQSDLGSACHAVILGGEEAIAVCDVTYPPKHKKSGQLVTDWKTGAAKEFRANAREQGRYPILPHKAARLPDMVKAVRAALATRGDLDQMRTEVTLIWEEEGIRCRARLDIWINDVIDLKTTPNAAPAKWARSALFTGGYDIQGAWQLRGLEALTGAGGRDFYCLAAEHSAPFGCSFIGLHPGAQWVAQEDIDHALKVWRKCERLQQWPNYSLEPHDASAQPWREARAAERRVGEAA